MVLTRLPYYHLAVTMQEENKKNLKKIISASMFDFVSWVESNDSRKWSP